MTASATKSRTADVGSQMHALAAELFPICRSTTGPGVRQTLARLAELVPLEIHEVPSGTKVFDWEVPREWAIRDAYSKDKSGHRIVDFQKHNLHVIGHSVPVRATMAWSQLKPHLHSLPDRPEWVPYRNWFSRDEWGFCISHRQFMQLEAAGERTYEVCIDCSLDEGSLTYGEVFLPGTSDDEVLI